MDLVLLALQPAKESADARVRRVVRAATVDDEALLLGRQRGPRHVEAQARFLGGAFQISEMRTVVRLAPGLDRVLRD